MKLTKNETGSGEFFTPIATLVLVFGILFAIFKVQDLREADFKAYFSIDPHSAIGEKELVAPMIRKKLEDLNRIKNDASDVVAKIRTEPESLTPEELHNKLERLKVARQKEGSAWLDWEKACRAAQQQEFVKECDATK